MQDYNKYMRKYKDKYWCLMNEDGIYCLIDHNLYLKLKQSDKFKDTKAQTYINGFNEGCSVYQLVCINSSNCMLNKRLDVLTGLDVKLNNINQCDAEVSFTFEPKDLDKICEVFSIKKKVKRDLTEEQRQEMSIRLKERFNK